MFGYQLLLKCQNKMFLRSTSAKCQCGRGSQNKPRGIHNIYCRSMEMHCISIVTHKLSLESSGEVKIQTGASKQLIMNSGQSSVSHPLAESDKTKILWEYQCKENMLTHLVAYSNSSFLMECKPLVESGPGA